MTQNSTDLIRRVIERWICFRSVPDDVRVDLYPDFIRDDVDLLELRWLLGQDIRCLGLYGQPDPGLKPPVITLNDILSSPVLDSRHRPLHRLVAIGSCYSRDVLRHLLYKDNNATFIQARNFFQVPVLVAQSRLTGGPQAQPDQFVNWSGLPWWSARSFGHQSHVDLPRMLLEADLLFLDLYMDLVVHFFVWRNALVCLPAATRQHLIDSAIKTWQPDIMRVVESLLSLCDRLPKTAIFILLPQPRYSTIEDGARLASLRQRFEGAYAAIRKVQWPEHVHLLSPEQDKKGSELLTDYAHYAEEHYSSVAQQVDSYIERLL